jgi:hypothetical protein
MTSDRDRTDPARHAAGRDPAPFTALRMVRDLEYGLYRSAVAEEADHI